MNYFQEMGLSMTMTGLKKLSVAMAAVVTMSLTYSMDVAAHNHSGDSKKHQHQKNQGIMVHMAWARALPPVAMNGAAYLMLHNNGKQTSTLVSASSPIAKSVMLHQSVESNGSVSMQHVDSLEIKPKGAVTFKPGGYHLMLMGLKKPLIAGKSFPVTLNFSDGYSLKTLVKIKKGNQKAPSMSHQHMKHEKSTTNAHQH
ncbi:hypothetical protein CW748_03655 [Alteromonadales bacterium alter-6D02]|nr:hypothetical protein CW748_03655 [Alteromonadales bacterium alter-6D02]